MAKPVRHRGKWRIRWTDEHGQRQSETYEEYRDAQFKLSQHRARVEEVKRGLRAPTPPDRTFDELCRYWLERQTPVVVEPEHLLPEAPLAPRRV